MVAIFTSSTFNEDDPALSFVTQPAAAKSANSGGAGKAAAPSGKRQTLAESTWVWHMIKHLGVILDSG